jgi:hypothetical protein
VSIAAASWLLPWSRKTMPSNNMACPFPCSAIGRSRASAPSRSPLSMRTWARAITVASSLDMRRGCDGGREHWAPWDASMSVV